MTQKVICDPDVKVVERQSSDQFIILACDGIWDCLSSEDCVTQTRDAIGAMRADATLNTPIEDMFDRIIAKDIVSSQGVGTDNMTCIIVQIKPNRD